MLQLVRRGVSFMALFGLLLVVSFSVAPATTHAICIFGIGNTCPTPPATPPPPTAPPSGGQNTPPPPLGTCYLNNQVYGSGMTQAQCAAVGGTWSATPVVTPPSTPGGTVIPPPTTNPTATPPPPVVQNPSTPNPPAGPLSYTPINPLPGVSGNPGTINLYLSQMYTFIIGFIFILAFFAFSYGAFSYVLATVTSKKQDAKDWMTGAIYGLLIAIASYLILYTINPALLTFDVFKNFGTLNIQVTIQTVGANGQPVTVQLSGSTAGLPAGTSFGAAASNIQSNYGAQIAAACQGSSVPNCQNVMASLCAVENPSANPSAVNTNSNGTQDIGLCQVNSTNAGGANLANPTQNLQAAAKILNTCYQNANAGGSVANAFACYNGGAGALGASANCTNPPLLKYQCTVNAGGYAATQKYVANICYTVSNLGGAGC